MKKLFDNDFFMGTVSLSAKTIQMTPIPATQSLLAKETTALSFASLEMLKETVALSDPAVIEKW